ncbi:MAG: hypothetical protein OJF60_001573 [Burkholderiaceae bacterium]|jgi:hypothetical protein|nr:MAG: hypothetical protein OJF60_001573 [Burkholderiaceae bacterium]
MKRLALATLFSLVAAVAGHAYAESQIYRCGNEYTNDAADAKARGCKPFTGGNITIIQGTRPAAPARTTPPASQPRVPSAEQRARDADARAILEAELQKAQARQTELLKEYNNGQPDKIGGEAHNYQKYLDRVAEMKAAIDRNQADIEGIQRELSRLPPPPAPGASQ